MNHAHHWLIATPEPGLARLPATCRHCSAERDFPAGPIEDRLTKSEHHHYIMQTRAPIEPQPGRYWGMTG